MVQTISLPKISAAFILVCLILICAYPALAMDATSPATTRKTIIQEKIDVKKEAVTQRIENLKDKMATREAALKARLDKFKDKKKAETADRVNTNLNMINKNQTEQMQKLLDKMSSILARVETNNGSSSSISDAKSSIASASAAVKTQGTKDYTLTITSETTAKTDIQKIRTQLMTDLKTVKQMVITAKQSVANAIRTVNSGKGDNGKQ